MSFRFKTKRVSLSFVLLLFCGLNLNADVDVCRAYPFVAFSSHEGAVGSRGLSSQAFRNKRIERIQNAAQELCQSLGYLGVAEYEVEIHRSRVEAMIYSPEGFIPSFYKLYERKKPHLP